MVMKLSAGRFFVHRSRSSFESKYLSPKILLIYIDSHRRYMVENLNTSLDNLF